MQKELNYEKLLHKSSNNISKLLLWKIFVFKKKENMKINHVQKAFNGEN